MKVCGIDFTSAPSHKKPITCADCTLENGFLNLNDLKNMETFDQFDEFLASGTEWIAGIFELEGWIVDPEVNDKTKSEWDVKK